MNNSFFNPSKVKEQYKNSDNLDARIRLHTLQYKQDRLEHLVF